MKVLINSMIPGKKGIIFQLFCFLLILSACSETSPDPELSLPKIISDGMVLQHGAEITVWGWAPRNSEVVISIADESVETVSNQRGEWEVTISAQNPGGPHNLLVIAGDDSIQVQDILFGEVWVASGQSNMELPMRRVWPLYQDDIDTADFPNIRYFEVPKYYDFKTEQVDYPGGSWVSVNSETIPNISAAAYFFARNLYENRDIPVGIVLSALGGSPAEAWMSETALEEFPHYLEEAHRYQDDRLIEKTEREDQERIGKWYSELLNADVAYNDPHGNWYHPDVDDTDWDTMNIPGFWADTDLGSINGSVWFRRSLTLSSDWDGKSALLELGAIVDSDSVFVNGQFVGNTTYQYPPRWYQIPEGVLKAGENTIVIRVINESGRGGFVPDKPYELSSGDLKVDLQGSWKYRLGVEMPALQGQTFIRWKPMGLYQAMIAPITKKNIAGVIWYQGESNTRAPEEYETLFPALIADWRTQWNEPELPFIYVQLASFMESSNQPQESNWAALREAQRKTLSVPKTAMAVATDIGEWNDIHPLNKKDVGDRLALAARNMVYGEDLVYSGPLISSAIRNNEKVQLEFDHIGSGLMAGNGLLQGFAIAGSDQNFVWANAQIDGNRVIVWSDEIDHPETVRYGWANNPESANLFNLEGLPASPFQISDFE